MVQKIFLIIIIFPFVLVGQEQQKTLLIVPPSKNSIRFSSLTERNIKYNSINRDSIIEFIVSTINSEVKVVLKKYSLKYLKEFTSSDAMPDTSYELKLWNCFYYNTNDSSLNSIKNNRAVTMNSYHNNYYGSNLNQYGLEILKKTVTLSKCDYILFINKFEIINPNSYFSLHVEVLDNSLNRIYGNKNEIKREISKTMYSDVLRYYIRASCEEMLEKVDQFLK